MRKVSPIVLLQFATWLFLAGVAGFLLPGCFKDSPTAGGSTETETGTAHLSGEVKWPDGRPVIGARARLRRSDFLAGSIPQPVDSGRILADTVTDSEGRYTFRRILTGEYHLEVLFSEDFGAVTLIEVPPQVARIELADMVLQFVLTVSGRVIFSDSTLGPATVHVLGTEHSATADSLTGIFTLRDLPPGIFDLRVSTPIPFFAAKEFPGQVVEGQTAIDIGDLVLDKGSKQEFSLAGGSLSLAGFDGSNPIIYDNDFVTNTWDNEVLWALASLGRVDLRGNIATAAQRDTVAMSPEIFASWGREARRSRQAGMRNIPEPVPGASRRLVLPRSGRWQDIVPESNPGTALLLSEARKASAEKPLVVVAEGALTTVAQAVLLDPYIADRMLVFGAYNHDLNGKDSLASYLVARKCRLVEWGRDYTWSGPGPSGAPLPGNRLGLEIKASRDTTVLAPLFFADFSALAFLMDRQTWKSARGAKVLAPPLSASLEGTGPSDFLDIPRDANDWALMDKVFFNALADSGAYHPWPVPGTVAGVSFQNMTGGAVDSVAGEGEVVVEIGPGDWIEYALESPAAGTYEMVLRYRGAEPVKIRISGQEIASADLDLPSGTGWVEERTRLTLMKGVQNVQISTVNGTWELSRLEWKLAP
jgi:hypothetical protein